MEAAQKLAQAQIEARQAAEQRAKQEIKARKAAQITTGVAVVSAVIVSVIGFIAYIQQQEAKIQTAKALTQTAETFLVSRKPFDALIAGIKAARELQTSFRFGHSDILNQTKAVMLVTATKISEFNRLQGHEAWVSAVSFSPDGEVLASASSDGIVRLWRKDGTPIKTLEAHEAWVSAVSFSPDGSVLASASYDGTVRLWKKDGTPIKTLEAHEDSVNAVSFSPDGEVLASASGKGGPLGISISISGLELLGFGSNDNTVRLWSWDLNVLVDSHCNWLQDYLKTQDQDFCDYIKEK